MSNLYLRSTDGADSDTGLTWALAKATLGAAGIGGMDAIGDIINISSVHAESSASAITFTCAGTAANPTRVLSVNDAAEPPTALAAGASVTTTGASDISLNGSFYMSGISFISAQYIALSGGNVNGVQFFDACNFRMTSTGSSGRLVIGQDNSVTRAVLRNCGYKFAGAANHVILAKNVEIRGGAVEAGSSTPTVVFKLSPDRTACRAMIEAVDFSPLAATVNFFDGGSSLCSAHVSMRNCKLPASWSGALLNSAIVGPGQRYEMINCGGSASGNNLWVEDYSGTIKHELTNVKTGGAVNGSTAMSWKMVTNANATYPAGALYSIELHKSLETVGSPVTLTVDILHDSLTALNNDEIWMEVEYLSSSAAPLGTLVSNAKASVLTAAAAQPASTATWTTTGLTNPNKQKLAVTFTPQLAGFAIAKIYLSAASKTVFVDNTLQVS